MDYINPSLGYMMQALQMFRDLTGDFLNHTLSLENSVLDYFKKVAEYKAKTENGENLFGLEDELGITKGDYERLLEDGKSDPNKETNNRYAGTQIVGKSKTDQVAYIQKIREKLEKDNIPSFTFMPLSDKLLPAMLYVAQKNEVFLERARKAALIEMGAMSFCTNRFDMENATKAPALLEIGKDGGLSDIELYTFARTLKQHNQSKETPSPVCAYVSPEKHIFYRVEDRASMEYVLQLTRSRLLGENALQYAAESLREDRQDKMFGYIGLGEKERYVVSATEPGNYIKITETGFQVFEPGLNGKPAEDVVYHPSTTPGYESWNKEIKDGAEKLYMQRVQSAIYRINAPVLLEKEMAARFKRAHIEKDEGIERINFKDVRNKQQESFGRIRVRDEAAQIRSNAVDQYDAAKNTEKELESLSRNQPVPESVEDLVKRRKKQSVQVIAKMDKISEEKAEEVLEREMKSRYTAEQKYNEIELEDAEKYIENEETFSETRHEGADLFLGKQGKLFAIEDMLETGFDRNHIDSLTKESLFQYEGHGLLSSEDVFAKDTKERGLDEKLVDSDERENAGFGDTIPEEKHEEGMR